jgi:hypothetical protein
MSLRLQLSRISAHWSQALNAHVCWIFGQKWAHHDLTVSARSHIEEGFEGSKGWSRARRVIDWVFRHMPVFGQEDHCRLSYERDIEFARELLKTSAAESKRDAPPQR